MKRRLWTKSKVGAVTLAIGARGASSLLFLLVSVGFLGVSLLQPKLFEGIRATTADLFAPVLSAVSQPMQDSVAFAQNVTGVAALREENIRLYQENLRLREWYQTALALESENQSLSQLLNVKLEPHHNYITSRVIADAGNAYVRSILVSAGLSDGVEKGQAVISAEGVIGRVVEVGQKASRVLLITDINSRVPILLEKTSHHAILAGNNSDMPALLHLPPDAAAEEGDRVVTSGYGGLFPKGLPVGYVSIQEDGSVAVKLRADLNRLVHVRVVDKAVDPNLVHGQLVQ